MNIFCNPLNLEYRFQHLKDHENPAFREAADPTLVVFKGRYYLFPSMCGGFWHSEDLVNWTFQAESQLMYNYAPDVHPIGEELYFCASTSGRPCKVLKTRDPLTEPFQEAGNPPAAWDPAIFADDDGKVYLYWGCSNRKPSIFGRELSPDTLDAVGKPVGLLGGCPTAVGWERTETFKWPARTFADKMLEKMLGPEPFIEGVFMTKANGRYYLQYAAPATEQSAYGNGVAVGASPLGPFLRQAHNPFSLVPGGFMRAAGHGSTMRDMYGNWWHTAAMRISVNAKFERRLGLFPCGFDEDGILFCNQNFADYPMEIPEGKFDPMSVRPKWMLLSYGKDASASSSLDSEHTPQYGVDESVTTCWCAENSNHGQWYMVDLGTDYDVRAIQVNFADVDVPNLKKPKNELHGSNNQIRFIDMSPDLRTQYLLEGSSDSESWFAIADKRLAETNLCNDFILVPEGVRVRYIRVIGKLFPYHSRMAISGLRIFGNGGGEAPAPVAEIHTQRTSPLDAQLFWQAVPKAQGYNIRWGIAPNKLYSSWLLYGQTKLKLPFLNAEQSEYYVQVDRFNENGITPGPLCKL